MIDEESTSDHINQLIKYMSFKSSTGKNKKAERREECTSIANQNLVC